MRIFHENVWRNQKKLERVSIRPGLIRRLSEARHEAELEPRRKR